MKYNILYIFISYASLCPLFAALLSEAVEYADYSSVEGYDAQ